MIAVVFLPQVWAYAVFSSPSNASFCNVSLNIIVVEFLKTIIAAFKQQHRQAEKSARGVKPVCIARAPTAVAQAKR